MFYTIIPATIVAIAAYLFFAARRHSGANVSESVLALQGQLDKNSFTGTSSCFACAFCLGWFGAKVANDTLPRS